jgi:hypothetical protein
MFETENGRFYNLEIVENRNFPFQHISTVLMIFGFAAGRLSKSIAR